MSSDSQLMINTKHPEDIMNWSAERYNNEFPSSYFHTPPNCISIMQKI